MDLERTRAFEGFRSGRGVLPMPFYLFGGISQALFTLSPLLWLPLSFWKVWRHRSFPEGVRRMRARGGAEGVATMQAVEPAGGTMIISICGWLIRVGSGGQGCSSCQRVRLGLAFVVFRFPL